MFGSKDKKKCSCLNKLCSFLSKLSSRFKNCCSKSDPSKDQELQEKMKNILKGEQERTNNLYYKKIYNSINVIILDIVSILENLVDQKLSSEENKKKLSELAKEIKTKHNMSVDNSKKILSLISKEKKQESYNKEDLCDQITKYFITDIGTGTENVDKNINLDPEMFDNEIKVISNRLILEIKMSGFVISSSDTK